MLTIDWLVSASIIQTIGWDLWRFWLDPAEQLPVQPLYWITPSSYWLVNFSPLICFTGYLTGEFSKIRTPFEWDLISRSLVVMAVEGIIFFTITLLIEYFSAPKRRYVSNLTCCRSLTLIIQLLLNPDVILCVCKILTIISTWKIFCFDWLTSPSGHLRQ